MGLRTRRAAARALTPRHFERAGVVAEGLALRLDDARVGAAVSVDRLEKEAERAGAVDRAVARIVAVDDPAAGRRLFELHGAELLILAVEEGVVLEELRQLGAVERFVDAADAELRGGGADEREDVRHLGLERVVDGAIELDERLELAPARSQRRARVAHGARREAQEEVVEALLAGGVDEELLPRAEHDALDLGDVGLRPDEDFFPLHAGQGGGGSLFLLKE